MGYFIHNKNDQNNVDKRSSITWLITAQISMERCRVIFQQERIWKQVFCGQSYWKTNKQTRTKRGKQLFQVRFKFTVSFGGCLSLVYLLLPDTNWLTWGLPPADNTHLKGRVSWSLHCESVVKTDTIFTYSLCMTGHDSKWNILAVLLILAILYVTPLISFFFAFRTL